VIKIVAELSGSHGGSFDNCIRLIEEAKKLKVDAIKLQTYDPALLAEKRKHLFPDVDLLALYNKTYTPRLWWPHLTEAIGDYEWGVSVFSQSDLHFMTKWHQPKFLKIASFELTDIDLIRDCAATHLPLVISVGPKATAQELTAALKASEGSHKRIFLAATPYGKSTLEPRVGWIALGLPLHIDVGLSDHSPPDDHRIACYAAALQVAMIERHLCLPDVPTHDTSFSSTPLQFRTYIDAVRGARGYAYSSEAAP